MVNLSKALVARRRWSFRHVYEKRCLERRLSSGGGGDLQAAGGVYAWLVAKMNWGPLVGWNFVDCAE